MHLFPSRKVATISEQKSCICFPSIKVASVFRAEKLHLFSEQKVAINFQAERLHLFSFRSHDSTNISYSFYQLIDTSMHTFLPQSINLFLLLVMQQSMQQLINQSIYILKLVYSFLIIKYSFYYMLIIIHFPWNPEIIKGLTSQVKFYIYLFLFKIQKRVIEK